VSVASPLVNAYAIPIISLVVTPLSLLLAAVAFVPGLEWLAGAFAWLGHAALSAMMAPTVWLSALGPASFDAAAAPLGLTLAALLGLMLAVLPYGFPARQAAWLFMLPALFWRPGRPADGGWNLTALDVGQSSAIVVQTAHHALLFDTGLRTGPDSDEGARTVWPFMQAQGIKKLDVIVVSHADIDHAGGMRSLLSSVRVEQSYSSFDLPAYLRREAGMLGKRGDLPVLPRAISACQSGTAWRIDGVSFEFLWPMARGAAGAFAQRRERNGQACVLLVRGLYHSALLTSDIGAAQEAALLERGLTAVDVVIAAHHGSEHSSSPGFVQAVHARHAIAQAGKWNRYGHPSPSTQQRWEQAGARFWRTDNHGAVSVRSRAGGLAVESIRQSDRHYWQDR
jgi:competence protein ComEC